MRGHHVSGSRHAPRRGGRAGGRTSGARRSGEAPRRPAGSGQPPGHPDPRHTESRAPTHREVHVDTEAIDRIESTHNAVPTWQGGQVGWACTCGANRYPCATVQLADDARTQAGRLQVTSTAENTRVNVRQVRRG